MNKEKIIKKAYLIGKIKEQVTLSKEGKVLSPTKVLEMIPKIFLRIIKRNIFKGKTQQNFIARKKRDMPNNYVTNNEQKEPVKCWECQGPHYAKDYPNRKMKFNNMHTIQEEASNCW